MVLNGLAPEKVFKYFEEISSIPRESGNEQAISDYLVAFAKERGLWVYQDEALNVYIKKEAAKGYEDHAPVILQGHMDMVCTKLEELDFDFEKDPIPLVVDGAYIRTKGTTLGADNGIAVAMAMAVLDDESALHPPLEVLITTEEETGLSGAAAVEGEHLQGQTLINIDSEEEGIFLTSCAGGVRVLLTQPVKWVPATCKKAFEIKISGLTGGHSGIEIDKERANGIKLLGRILESLPRVELAEVTGGEKMNAIAKRALAVVHTEKDLTKVIAQWEETFRREYQNTDPELVVTLREVAPQESVMDERSLAHVTSVLRLLPQGIQTMSTDIEGLVESSNNVGVLTTTEKGIVFESAVRSSLASQKEEIVGRMESLASLTGGYIERQADYPAWEFNPTSTVREIMLETYEALTGKPAKIEAIHAGLECGILGERIGDIDMISFGPDMGQVHTPKEYLSIPSVETSYKFLLKVLEKL